MPTDVTNSSTAPHGLQAISNDLDDMHAPSIGPDQADCRVKSVSYVSFDYAGKMSADPVVAIRATCEPIDGSNEGKDFDIEWTTGGKMAEFSIVNDGGNIVSTGTKNSLTNTSNWALLQRSLKDASFDTKLLNGPRGIRHLEGIEWTLRRIKQPKRDGLKDQNEGGREKEYYSCLKILALPGEKRPATGRARTATTANKPTAASATVTKPSTTTASNGNGSTDLTGFILTALDAAGGTLTVTDLAKAVFKAARASGQTTKDAMEIGQSAANEDFLIEQAMSSPATWLFDNGTLTRAS